MKKSSDNPSQSASRLYSKSSNSSTQPRPIASRRKLTRGLRTEEEKQSFITKGFKPERKLAKKKAPVVDGRREEIKSVDAPTALVVQKEISTKDEALINASLRNHFIFTSLTEENRLMLIEQMKHYSLGRYEIIFEQGQPGNNFFIVESGKLEVLINNQRKNLLMPGDSFGELALMHGSPRSATVRSIEKVTLWGLDRRTFRTAVEAVNAQNYLENRSFIDSVPLLSILNSSQHEALVASLSTLKFAPGEKIVNEGDPGDLFYIIKEGSVTCTKDDIEIRTLSKGEYFGEQALLYNSPRTATVSAIDEVKCVAIGRERLTKVLGSQLQQIIYQNSLRMILDKSNDLRKLNKSQSDNIFKVLQVNSAYDNQVVVHKGTQKGTFICFILKGRCKNAEGEIIVEQFGCIGDNEISLPKTSNTIVEDILADGEVDYAVISREDFEKCIGGEFQFVTEHFEASSLLSRVQLLKGITPQRQKEIVRMLKQQNYNDGEVIVEQNRTGEHLYIIKSGQVAVYKDGEFVRSITKLDYFGERSILFDEFRSATIVAKGNVSCWLLHKNDFLSIIDERIRFNMLNRIELQDDSIHLDDIRIVRHIGKGMFGNVFLVVHKQKRKLFALKTIDRRKIEAYELYQNLVLERSIMMQLDHTFILKIIRTSKDSHRLYFIMEFVRGSDLFDVLRVLGLLEEKDCRFYTASLILILEHLHERDIIYRDLKPENVMVDEEGYLKLIDFGTAKIVNGRTYTIIGTPQYMAPEVIIGKGYGVAADYWSLGIILYEFIYGAVPFGEEDEDPYVVYEKVLEHRIKFPSAQEYSPATKQLIEQLLSKNPAMRIGGSFENLKKHPWFLEFDWVSYI